jgi:peptidyl-prolyl cis-trans isomerase A (cyclophilin A)
MARLCCAALLLASALAQPQDEPDAIVDFQVQLQPGATVETVSVVVHRRWAPRGAARFLKLVDDGHFDGCSFFRVINKFMAQFGISGDPEQQAKWKKKTIPDEGPETQRASNTRGRVTFAHAGPNSRSTQLFINFGDNSRLDRDNFPPFGEVVDMGVVDRLHVTGEGGPKGPGPAQGKIQQKGDAYLRAEFPGLSRIVSAARREEVMRPHREGDLDGDGKLDAKDAAIAAMGLRGAPPIPAAAAPPPMPPPVITARPYPWLAFAAATAFFVIASARRRRTAPKVN